MRRRNVAELRASAERVLAAADLEEVYLARVNFETNAPGIPAPFDTETTLQVRGEQAQGRVETWSKYVTSAFKDSDDPEDERQTVWTMELECVAFFSVPDDSPAFSQEDLEAFAVVMGAPTLHPYAREYTQSLTAKSVYPALTIGLLTPVLAFPDEHELEFSDADD